jgi:glycosyltransferase involved in cell wall biosynthesis
MRILVIDARVVTPDRDGGSLRMLRLLTILKGLGCHVAFAPDFPRSFPPFSDSLDRDEARLRDAGIDLPLGPAAPTVEAHLEADGRRYDVVLMTGVHVASKYLGRVRRHAPGAVVVFDTIDLHFLREYRAARLTGQVRRLQFALKVKRVELAVARAADVTLVVSERERELLGREDPAIRVSVIPNIHDVAASVPPFASRAGLLYLGAFTFDPNADAVTWFVRDILPSVRARLPGIRFTIAGADPTDEVKALAGDEVTVTGYVPDLAPLFAAHRVFVAPLRYGAGIKGKLLSSMAEGLPAVVSPIAVEGIAATPGQDVLVAGHGTDWAGHIARVHEDEAVWTRLSDNGQALVRRHYSTEVVEHLVVGLLQDIAVGSMRPAPGACAEGRA